MITIETNLKQTIVSLEKWEAKKTAQIKKELLKQAEKFKEDLKAEQFSGRRGKKWLNIITGKAHDSWKIKESGTGNNYKIRIFSNVPYIVIHEMITHRLRLRERFKTFFKSMDKIVKKILDKKD
jgi:hypothetical protein